MLGPAVMMVWLLLWNGFCQWRYETEGVIFNLKLFTVSHSGLNDNLELGEGGTDSYIKLLFDSDVVDHIIQET